MESLFEHIHKELVEGILPFWLDKIDNEHGGFYGYMDEELVLDKKAPKGGLACARLLWTFSSAYRVLGDEACLVAAHHAYKFLVEHLLDEVHKGIYWLVDFEGHLLDGRKHIYVQAFGVYALSEYYRATGEQGGLEKALELYELIHEKGYDCDAEAYLEEFDREWHQLDNEMLSENGVVADYTYNTHLHVLEAMTNLYRVWPNAELKVRIEKILDVFYQRIYNHETGFFKVFFDRQWSSLIDLISYGHDIESSWLIHEAIKVLAITDEEHPWMVMVRRPAYGVLGEAMDSLGAMNNEKEKGVLDDKKIWWVQAEAFVGYINMFELTKDEAFLKAAHRVWSFIEKYIVDKREGGEWHAELDSDYKVMDKPVIEPWKLNYHNGRCCLEFVERSEMRISKAFG